MLQIHRRRAQTSAILKDTAGSQISSLESTSYNRSWRPLVLSRVLPSRLLFRFPNVRWFVCVLGVTWAHWASTGRGDESGIVRRPRRGLYSPSLDISRETTPSSAPDDTTVGGSISPGLLRPPNPTGDQWSFPPICVPDLPQKWPSLATPSPTSCAKGFSQSL